MRIGMVGMIIQSQLEHYFVITGNDSKKEKPYLNRKWRGRGYSSGLCGTRLNERQFHVQQIFHQPRSHWGEYGYKVHTVAEYGVSTKDATGRS